MGNPTTELQQLTNKSIIELFSVELKAGVHFLHTSKTGTYVQDNGSGGAGTIITISGVTDHGLSVGLVLNLNFATGGAADGIYTIQSVPSTSSFTVTSIVSAHITGTHNVSFDVNTTPTTQTIYLFHDGNNFNDGGDLKWQSNTYARMPCKAEGFKYTGKGKLPRPTITFANLLSTITVLLQLGNLVTPFSDLQGAKVTRRRTLARFLDEDNFSNNVNPFKVGSVDPTAEMPQEIYFIERKVVENRNIVQFELVSCFDLQGVSAPKKLVTRDDFAGVGTFVNF